MVVLEGEDGVAEDVRPSLEDLKMREENEGGLKTKELRQIISVLSGGEEGAGLTAAKMDAVNTVDLWSNIPSASSKQLPITPCPTKHSTNPSVLAFPPAVPIFLSSLRPLAV